MSPRWPRQSIPVGSRSPLPIAIWSCKTVAVVSGVAFVASLLGSVREAQACSPPPSGWFPSGVMPTPANGVVLVRYSCYENCETPPNFDSLLIKNEANELVPGSIVFSQVRGTALEVAFLPEPGALTEAHVYTAELEGVPAIAGILVGPALTWNDAISPREEIFEVDDPTGESRCCEGPVDACGNTPCFRTQVERRTAVTVGWYEDPSSEHYQYVYRLGRDAIDPAAPWSWDGGDARFELDPGEDSACYVLELKRLADDSVQTFAMRCIEQPDTFTPGLHVTPDEDVAAVLQACDEPPDGYEPLWCEARLPLCETSPDEPWCADFIARCDMLGAGGAAGSSSVAGAGGAAGSAGTGGTGVVAAGGATAGGGEAGTPEGTGGTGGSSAGQGGSGGKPATGGATSIPPDAGATAGASASNGEAGEAGEAGQGERVFTKGCGCTVPGRGPREPAPLVMAVALAAAALRLRRARSRARA
jgi:MYXO-CTERM domain-containing protein